MLLKEIFHCFVFCFYVKITKKDHFFSELSRVLIDLSNTRENIFIDGALKIDATNHFSFLRFTSKGTICILDGILTSLSLLDGMCDLTNTITPPLFSVICSIYGLILLIYELIIGETFI